MRKFSSYGPVDKDINYYVPRIEIIEKAHQQLIGNTIEKGGHYYTVWAPRQCGKSWTLIQVLSQLQQDERFYVAKINMETVKGMPDIKTTYKYLINSMNGFFNMKLPIPATRDEFQLIFRKESFDKPLILILDEFDALEEHVINDLVSVFRDIYQKRNDQAQKNAFEKDFVLHGIALIGVRSVLGIENIKGSPFNVQRSLHIPNLTFDNVKYMFDWYTRETGQPIDSEVVERIYYETNGQPGLVSWFGELLTEEYNEKPTEPITIYNWNGVYSKAKAVLPNNNILNLISKATNPLYKETVLKIFESNEKQKFRFDDKIMNYLYTNGVIDYETELNERGEETHFAKFSCPFAQKRLFNYFSNELYGYTGKRIEPFDTLEDAITENEINIKNIIRRYEVYVNKNRDWLFKNAPHRSDNRIFEAVFHFNLYRYLFDLLEGFSISIYPEFPTGNGKIDLLLHHNQKLIGLELKSFSDVSKYKRAIIQAARYAKSLKLQEINLLFFIESIDDENRKRYEIDYTDTETGVKVIVVFAQTGI